MGSLKALNFSTLKDLQPSPTLARRSNLIAHLEEQKALVVDPLHLRTEHRWVIQQNGFKERIDVRKRVRAWWRTDPTGKVYLTVRYGAKAIEFEKGKPAIVVQDKGRLSSVLDTLIEATKAGELDDHLAQHAKLRGISRNRRTA